MLKRPFQLKIDEIIELKICEKSCIHVSKHQDIVYLEARAQKRSQPHTIHARSNLSFLFKQVFFVFFSSAAASSSRIFSPRSAAMRASNSSERLLFADAEPGMAPIASAVATAAATSRRETALSSTARACGRARATTAMRVAGAKVDAVTTQSARILARIIAEMGTLMSTFC